MSIRNFDALFDPKAIALVGASDKPGSVGRVLAENLFRAGFGGPVMAVNPHDKIVRSTIAYPSVADLPICPDLAVLATPAAVVPSIVADLAGRGCRAAIVITAFGGGETGRRLRREMFEAARPCLMRIVGPNCLGVISPGKGINASFAHLAPSPGAIALVSQSGAIVTAMLDWADRQGIGFSHVVSLGDMSDVDFGDLLDFLAADSQTGSILLYIENVTHAPKFMSAARIAARAKPVLVVKSGRSAAGAQAALTHTGALAGADAVYDAAFRRAGLLRVTELEELFEAAATLATGMRPQGERLTILTNGGGAGVLAVDALAARGGSLAPLGEETRARLDAVLPATWSRANPIDILGDATGRRYAAALEAVLSDPCDAILVINCPTAVADSSGSAQAVAEAAAKTRRGFPILANWLGGTAAAPARRLLRAHDIPTFDGPEDAVRAFMHLVGHRRNQRLLLETPAAGIAIPQEAVDQGRVLVGEILRQGRSLLTEAESKRLMALFGIPTVPTLVAESPEQAAARAAEIAGPAALKILSPDIAHKSDFGGVCLGLAAPSEVETAAREMLAHIRERAPGARLSGFTVQPMIVRPGAHELIVGIAADATFGPVLLFGRGGKATELIGDRAVGLPPLNSVLARDMIRRTEVAKLLAGYRDVPPVSQDAVIDVLVRLSELLIHLPEIVELDINPLLADADGVIALDARVVVRESGAAMRPAIRPYPNEIEQEIALADGTRLLLRPIRPEDEGALIDMIGQCTPQDLRLRFLGPLKELPHEMAARLSQIDYEREMALVATKPGSRYGAGPLFGVIRLVRDPENVAAEFAVLVRSDWKGRGLGYRLMTEILGYARRRGLKRVFGDVLCDNTTMLRMADELGFVSEPVEPGCDVVRVTIELHSGSATAKAQG